MKDYRHSGQNGPNGTGDQVQLRSCLFSNIVQATPAAVDQEHLRIIIDNNIDNNPQVPSRSRKTS